MRAEWDDELSILSSENVNFAVETAGLGSRFTAVVIDMTLQLVVFLVMCLIAVYGFNFLPTEGDVARWAVSVGGAIFILITFILWYGYYFFFEWLWDGQTPGKRWLGLRVLQTSGLPATVWPILLRNLLRIVDFLPLFYGVGALVSVVNPHNRRVGDLVGGTIVVRERRDAMKNQVLDINTAVDAFLASAGSADTASRPEETAVSRGPATTPAVQPAEADIDPELAPWLRRLNEEDYELVREFLRRRDTLQPIARERLGRNLATRLSLKLNRAAPPPQEVESFLETLAHALQQTRQR